MNVSCCHDMTEIMLKVARHHLINQLIIWQNTFEKIVAEEVAVDKCLFALGLFKIFCKTRKLFAGDVEILKTQNKTIRFSIQSFMYGVAHVFVFICMKICTSKRGLTLYHTIPTFDDFEKEAC